MDVDREAALAVAYDAVRPRLEFNFDVFRKRLLDWEVHPVLVRGQMVGAVLVNGSEYHPCISAVGHKHWFNKAQIRLLRSIIAKYGRVTSHTTTEAGEVFARRIGFERQGDLWVLARL